MVKKKYKEERKIVSRLIYMVLAETLHVKDAILKFPKDINDESIKAAHLFDEFELAIIPYSWSKKARYFCSISSM